MRALSSYCLEIASALAQHTEVKFISFRKIYPAILYPGGKLENDYSFPEIQSPALQVSRNLTWYNPFTWLKAGFFTKAELLHAQWWSAPLLPIYLLIAAAFRIRGKPVVITIHNVVSHEQSRLFSRLSGLLYKLGNHYIVHSQQNHEQLMRLHHIDQGRINVIPHGPLELFTDAIVSRSDARSRLGFSDQHKVILLFGAIRPYKGIDTALDAISALVSDMPGIRVLIAGKLWGEWKPYQQQIDKLGLAEYVSCHLDYIPTAEVSLYFQAADLVLLPYHHFDSQSGIGSAAIAFEKPLIVSDTGGLPDLVRDNRWIVPPKDAGELANAIKNCLQDPEQLQQMQKNAGRMREEFSWDAIAEKTMEVYAKMLK